MITFCHDMKELLDCAKTEDVYKTFISKITKISIMYSKRKQKTSRKQKRVLEKQITYERVKMQKSSDYDETRLRDLEDHLDVIISDEIKGVAIGSKRMKNLQNSS